MTFSSETQEVSPVDAHQQGSTTTPLIAIMLCTYNGARFLEEQLVSILKQTHTQWVIHASDDGSSDATCKLLANFQNSIGIDRLRIYEGPKQGFAKNFLSLIKNKSIEGDYFAFCDQDDIWHPTKLEKSLSQLQKTDPDQPSLYCSRVRLIDAKQRCVGLSPLRKYPPTFKNALVQSLAGANTMMINRSTRSLMAVIPDDVQVVAHDWLAYLLVTASDGRVIYENAPSLDYRQHENNAIGNKTGLHSKFLRIKRFTDGKFTTWGDMNCQLLDRMLDHMSPENQATFRAYKTLRSAGLVKRITLFFRTGLYRQGSVENCLLFFALILKKI
ncbi:hypothetical protein CKQ80_22515 [Pseudomonas moraviensis]|uniref:Glycosyltransferase 2-like domain-containing protein n=1 Tax=Pseudomonas moraviensis TaxID=321662 RepID=A0A2A2PQL1_9PSED|nr:glycosyltransferase family 2 protein [Pseudomonas moraviensis]PAW51919.1 hypothetical protein CKQ68_06695 [Pseudomonas moraviensis]PAW57956.1 hypothetical protein CKQ80_22515 [Pseudomonas moraviensis]